jgi:hypothetical protein
MAPDIGTEGVPAGDVAGAMMEVDALLQRIHGLGSERDEVLDPAFLATTAEQVRQRIEGYCSLIYIFISGWCNTLDERGKGVLKEIIPEVVDGLRQMPVSVAPSTIPTMAAMLTAAALGKSPTAWRTQFGDWLPEEIPALEATATALAEGVNNAHKDPLAAMRIVADILLPGDQGTSELPMRSPIRVSFRLTRCASPVSPGAGRDRPPSAGPRRL